MRVAVLGATGAVGRTMLQVLEERAFPFDELLPLASARSAGSTVSCAGREWTVRAPEPGLFRNVRVALFSAGAERSREWGPRAAEEGAVVIDNSSAWRMDPDVPLVVPEVNAGAMARRPRGIIANPNCSTIQTVVALGPLRDAFGLERVDLVTFQSVSGAGQRGIECLEAEAGGGSGNGAFTRPIHGNAVPQIGDFEEGGWTGEEWKMIRETRKILDLPDLAVTATCVRVPVRVGHAVQAIVRAERPLELEAALAALEGAPGLVLHARPDDFPTPHDTAGSDEIEVGRVRLDPADPRRLHLWIVGDNLRKGAATNAVQIAERILDE
jgi:aspartate-semialdehyde dehydrogenase